MSLRDALNGHRNSLGIIRLVLAAAVIFDHAFPLGGWGTAPFLSYTRDQQSLGGLAVLGFFAISGYLVTKSGLSTDVVQFVWRRFLRIFPGFWLALIVGGFLVGPVIWLSLDRPLAGYFGLGMGGPFAYLYNNFTLAIGQFAIWDIFTTNPYGLDGNGGPMNGSIWTLIYEWTCYVMLAVLIAFGILKRAKLVVPVITAFFLVMQVLTLAVPGATAVLIPFFADPWRVNFGLIFFVGACIGLYSDKIPFDNYLGVFAGVFSAVTLAFGGFNTLGYIAFAYFMLYLAARLPQRLQWIGAKNDYSYGVYLYGWIAEQGLAFLGVHRWGYFPYVALSLIVAFGCAWLSWHIVEKQAMKLKDRGPGRGIRFWFDATASRFGRRGRAAEVVSDPTPTLPPTTTPTPAAQPKTAPVVPRVAPGDQA